MKNLITFFCFICFIGTYHTLFAQETADALDPISYKKRSPIYDYSEHQLNNTDTIPDFAAKPDKLKITGTIYQSDGKTPAKDIVLFIFQPDEDGNYEMKRDDNHKRYVHHRAWIKTDADGHYTFYTFMPGKYWRDKELKQIHRIIKEPGKPEYELSSFFFNDDPLLPDLTLACRAKAVKSMLKLEKKGNMFVATKDIVLIENNTLVE
jgi:protocatechuate 3,4-dioxygenase, beta subunit